MVLNAENIETNELLKDLNLRFRGQTFQINTEELAALQKQNTKQRLGLRMYLLFVGLMTWLVVTIFLKPILAKLILAARGRTINNTSEDARVRNIYF